MKTIITVIAYLVMLAVILALGAAVIMGLGWLIGYAFNYPPAQITYVQAVAITLVLAFVSGLIGK